MRFTAPLLAATLVAGLVPVATATAAPMQPPVGVTQASDALVQDVQYRRGWRGGYGHRHYGHRHYGYRNSGAGLAAGLAAGALLGGALAAQAQPQYVVPGGDVEAYCFSRFKSYDPVSGTYLGYDGFRHPCP